MNEEMHRNCQCPCGATRFTVHGAPLIRAFCHCTICQAFNAAPYADITLFRLRDVDPPQDGSVEFKTYRPPPAAQRGKCAACGKPAIEFLRIPPMPGLVIVPTANIGDKTLVPASSMHIFYHRRVADIEDALPKYSGYWSSQTRFARRLLASMYRRAVHNLA